MLYQLREFQHALLSPAMAWAQVTARIFTSPLSPLPLTPGTQRYAVGYELLYHLDKGYEKPEFGIRSIESNDRDIPIAEQTIIEKPFCRLVRFKRYTSDAETIRLLRDEPVVLVCMPLSSYHSVLLRDTARTLLQDHEVYMIDWIDVHMVSIEEGVFHPSDYINCIHEFINHIGADEPHVISVRQPAASALAATPLMASDGEKTPRTVTMIGGPVDACRSPAAVNSLTTSKAHSWLEDNVTYTMPANYPGHGRKMYPGFLQHAGFVAMNPDHHPSSYYGYYLDLIEGDTEDAKAHVRLYDEYNAVLDMAAEHYLGTTHDVFQEFHLTSGTWVVRGKPVRPQDVKSTTLFTIGSELDDISGSDQTEAAHGPCTGISGTRKQRLMAPKCGHCGIFSGRHRREQVYPQLRDFICRNEETTSHIKAVI